MNESILIVEDEKPIREMLYFLLSKEGYKVEQASSVSDARNLVKKRAPGLILLDWMLPGISGVEFARSLRTNLLTKEIPIIMLTAKGTDAEKVQALDIGADDFITKPFSTKELLARIRAVFRRSCSDDSNCAIDIPGLQIDPIACQVNAGNNKIDLSPTEFRLLYFFICNPEKVFSRSHLLDQVWGQNVYVEDRTVDVHVRRLRKNLEPYGLDKNIQTARGFGYRFSLNI
jgi:two-component system, OmpR family, phosphate regulon response regulator PhoB